MTKKKPQKNRQLFVVELPLNVIPADSPKDAVCQYGESLIEDIRRGELYARVYPMKDVRTLRVEQVS